MTPAFRSVCLLHANRGGGSRYDRIFPPLGSEIVLGTLRDLPCERMVIDRRFDADWEELLPPGTDLAGLSIPWEMPLEEIRGITARLRRLRPGVRVVAGGRFACSFCTFNRDLTGEQIPFTHRSAESVVDEIQATDADYLVFVDENVCHDLDRMDRICELLLERGVRKTYGIETRIDLARRPEVFTNGGPRGAVTVVGPTDEGHRRGTSHWTVGWVQPRL